ncbi:MAG: carbohydrate ABC transporter permease [Silicimonas sp.]|jgi:multiple sugar transport system permease protein|uniref:carbohydrate ABC transporter permease n=1 Tax=Roseitalea porphyridii TaxID=1852022 RepID=UPI0032EEBA13
MNTRRTLSRMVSPVLLILGAAFVLLPFFWMLSLSIKPADEIFTPGLDLFPSRIEWRNYAKAFAEVELTRFLFNGAIVCLGILVFQILFAVPCAYALAHRDFALKPVVFGLVLAGLLVPFHVTAIPIFLALAEVRMLNTYVALIVPFVASVFGIFLFRQFFASVPAELFDAARVDGLSETAIVWRIAFPLAMPAATAFAIFSVTAHWNDLFWPLIATSDRAIATPPRGILYFRDEEAGSDFGPLMAAATVVTAPLIIGFLFAQRAFVRGIVAGGIKG